MKKFFLLMMFASIAVVSFAKSNDKIVVAYVEARESRGMPDPFKMTHINYAFGTVNDTFDGVNIQNVEWFKKILALKKVNPKLKVLLSIGGWTAGGFSEMASTLDTRTKFVADCKRILDEYGLDGIDLDWEYPTSSSAGIKSSPEDTDNFTALIKELRAKLGKSSLLTFASVGQAKFVDFKAVEPYLDFVNIMTYDMERPPKGGHHSALYSSKNAKESVDLSVRLHNEAGIPLNKIVVGIPFYGHGNTAKGYSDFVDYSMIETVFAGHKFLWDEDSKMPYVADKDDDTLIGVYDNERSIAGKSDYVFDKGLKGLMYWVHGSDGPDGPLSNAVYKGIMDRK